MARKVNQIRIESILGGHSPATHFAAEDQFLTSYSIDPSYGIDDSSQDTTSVPCGLLRPVASFRNTDVTINGSPMWFVSNPKNTDLYANSWYIYDAAGSVYTANYTWNVISAVGDLNDGGSASGNGCAYYDNYIYFARDTTIARYGPLDGTPSFTDDYWVTTLGKTALNETLLPAILHLDTRYPNHILHRHSDGKLYIADVVDNQGTIHFIQTTKTTVEGDTDAGSTYDAINVGYGLYPTAIESYGEYLVIAFIEATSLTNPTGIVSSLDTKLTAKVAFWDTTSDDVNQIIWVEYPDPLIGAIKNLNGTLHFCSGMPTYDGYRVMQYVGGNTFQEVFFSSLGAVPPPGAVDGQADRLVFGSKNEVPKGASGSGENACVWQLGLRQKALGQGIFNVRSVTTNSDLCVVTAVAIENSDSINQNGLIVGWSDTDAPDNGIERPSTLYGSNDTQWYSQIYKIGQPFKITKIRIPLAQRLTSNMTVVPYVWIDGIDDSGVDYTTLTTINSTNFGTKTRSIVLRPEDLKGDYSFSLSLKWTGTDLCVVALPIIIEYEFVDIDTHFPE